MDRHQSPLVLVALFGALLLYAPAARAQLQFAGDAPRVYTIEPREHLFRHQVTLGLGTLPLDAFYVALIGQAGYTYQFNDVWAWEVVNGFYAYSFDTALNNLLKESQVLPNKIAAYRLRSIVSSNVVVKPLYGKMALFNRGILRSETYLSFGAGVAISNMETGFAPNLGIGLNFWASHAAAFHFEVRDYFVVGTGNTGSVLQILLGASLHFNIATAKSATFEEDAE